MKVLDFNNLDTSEYDGLSEDELIKLAAEKALELLEAFKHLDPGITQTKIPAELTAVNNSKPYKLAVADQGYKVDYDGMTSLIMEPQLEYNVERLTPFDMAVQTAVGHLVDLAPVGGSIEPVYLSYTQIARELLGLTNRSKYVSGDLLHKIKVSVYKLQHTDAALKYTILVERNGERKEAQQTLRGPMLACDMVHLYYSGQAVDGIRCMKSRLPLHYQLAKDKGAVIEIDRRHLDTTRDNAENLHGLQIRRTTTRLTLVKQFLFREIYWQLRAPKSSRSLKYETIYEGIGEPKPGKKAQEQIDADIKYCLELWTRQGVIGGYTAKTQGKRVSKITFAPPA